MVAARAGSGLGLMPTMTIELSWLMAAPSRELSIEKSTLNYCWMFYFTRAKAAGYRMVTLGWVLPSLTGH